MIQLILIVDDIVNCLALNMSRFKLEKSTQQQGWWVLTDTVNLIVIRFQEHRFNETQKVSILKESIFYDKPDSANALAHIMSEMGDYMYKHWYSIAMPVPIFEFREDETNDKFLLIRNKFPRFVIEIQDNCDVKQLSDALKAASEFIRKRS